MKIDYQVLSGSQELFTSTHPMIIAGNRLIIDSVLERMNSLNSTVLPFGSHIPDAAADGSDSFFQSVNLHRGNRLHQTIQKVKGFSGLPQTFF